MTNVQPRTTEAGHWLVLGSANGSTNLGDEAMWLAAVDELRFAVGPVPVVTDGPRGWVPPRDDVRVLPPLHWQLRRGRFLGGPDQVPMIRRFLERLISRPRRNAYAMARSQRLRTDDVDDLVAEWRRAVRGSAGVVFSGAGAINDDFAVHGVAAWSVIADWAFAARRSTFFVGQGVGPLLEESARARTAEFLNQASLVTVREERSRREAEDLGVRQPVLVTGDWALRNVPTDGERTAASRLVQQAVGDASFIAISLHRRHSTSGEALRRLSATAEQIAVSAAGDGQRVIFVSNMTARGYSDDRRTAELVVQGWEESSRGIATIISDELSPGTTRALLSQADGLVSTRYHPMVFALAEGTPSAGLAYDAYYSQKLQGVSATFDVSSNVYQVDAQVGGDAILGGLKSQRVGVLEQETLEAIVDPFHRAVRDARG